MPLTDRAKNVLLALQLKGIGERPLFFVTHSMGGLLVKQLLHTANDSTNPRWRAILILDSGRLLHCNPTHRLRPREMGVLLQDISRHKRLR